MTPDYRSFLVINPFGIGDCLFSTPLLQCIRSRFPSARIYFLCNKKCYPVMSSHPLVEKAFIYERDEFVAAREKSFFIWLSKALGFISDIRRERIDVCLDLSLNTQYGFYAYLAGIPNRFGLDYKKRCFFLNKKKLIDGFCGRHVADFYLSVVQFLGLETGQYPMSVGIDARDRDWARGWLQASGIAAAQTIVGIAPCGGDSFGPNAHIRRWPAEYYAQLIAFIRKAYGAAVLVFAGPRESEDAAAIIEASGEKDGVYDLSSVTLGQTIALISHCSLFIGNDTGALRFADALQKKLIAFYGPADDVVYGPYPPDPARKIVLRSDAECRPCYRNFRLPACEHDRACLRNIPVETACAAVKQALEATS